MKFVTVRDLRLKPSQIWQKLDQNREMVLTSNGKPIALLTRVTEETLEEALTALRRARGLMAMEEMQRASVASGTDRLSNADIEAEIRAARRGRPR